MTDWKALRIGHGHIIRCLVREAFDTDQKITMDFDGMKEAAAGFVEAWFLPLVAEYDAGSRAAAIGVVNLESDLHEAFSQAEASVDRLTRTGRIECDMPRFTSAFLGEMSAMGFDEVDTLMALNGSII